MRGRSHGCMLRLVNDAAPIVLRLEIDRGREPIAGRLAATPEHVVAFTGWLGLAVAIEQATALALASIAQEEDER